MRRGGPRSIGDRRRRHKRHDDLAARKYDMSLSSGEHRSWQVVIMEKKAKAMSLFVCGFSLTAVTAIVGVPRERASQWKDEYLWDARRASA